MDDLDLTTAPRRTDRPPADDLTMPGRRDRKNDGKFSIGDLILNRYKVLSLLGQGGMGVVYKCFDEIAGIEIALKALPPELSNNTLEMEDIKDNLRYADDTTLMAKSEEELKNILMKVKEESEKKK